MKVKYTKGIIKQAKMHAKYFPQQDNLREAQGWIKSYNDWRAAMKRKPSTASMCAMRLNACNRARRCALVALCAVEIQLGRLPV
jgi:hypothetical protein